MTAFYFSLMQMHQQSWEPKYPVMTGPMEKTTVSGYVNVYHSNDLCQNNFPKILQSSYLTKQRHKQYNHIIHVLVSITAYI